MKATKPKSSRLATQASSRSAPQAAIRSGMRSVVSSEKNEVELLIHRVVEFAKKRPEKVALILTHWLKR